MISLNSFPVEILESIFCHLPLPELLSSHTRVCRKWRDIISRKEYLSNRKLYFRCIFRISRTPGFCMENDSLVYETEVCNQDITGFIPQTLSRVDRWAVESKIIQSGTFSHIKFHSRYSFARDIIKERFPERLDSDAAHVCMIALIARDVFDIREIIKVLISINSPATSIQATELLYFINALFLLGEKRLKIPNRLHYIVSYALYLYANSFNFDPTYFIPENVSTPKESQPTFSLTAEQKKIVHFDISSLQKSGGLLRIIAYAGTGKTTTLVELCKRNPSIKFLLVVFNRSVKNHSDLMFPKNVIVKTAHQLSWNFMMRTYGRERFQGFELKYNDIIENMLLGDEPFNGFPHFSRAAMVIQTLRNFYNSSDDEILMDHCPMYWKEEKFVSEHNRNILRKDAQDIWDTIETGRKSKIKFSHDSGMKAFQLSRPVLSNSVGHYDVLLLDEAQDMNPAMMDVCLSQSNPKIIVGDPHQQIYAFRGAVDALKAVESHASCEDKPIHTLYLSQSFRFGPEIAFVANTCLKVLKKVNHPPLVGGKHEDSVRGSPSPLEKIAVIGRSNVRLFEEMVQLVCEVEPAERPRIAFTVQTDDGDPLRLDDLVQLEYFRTGQLEKMNERKRNFYKWKTWLKYLQQVKDGNDLETLSRIEIVERYKEKIPEYVQILLEQSRNHFQASNVQYIFSTVHRFKGLECNTVRLLDDFDLSALENTTGESSVEEYNLLYVALTRAKRHLVLNDSLFLFLTARASGGEFNFESIVPRSSISETQCVRCEENVTCDQVVGVVQDEVQVLRQICRKGGALCPSCFRSSIRAANNKLLTSFKVRRGAGIPVQVAAIPSTFNQFYTSILCSSSEAVQRPIEFLLVQTNFGCQEIERLTDQQWRDKMKSLRQIEERKRHQAEVDQFMEEDDAEFLKLIEDQTCFGEAYG